jgi:ABC-2 type transport system ATP-binding protein
MSVPLQTSDLRKVYKLPKGRERVAVDSLTISVPQGAIFGFLGPNGAGKTTTIKMILDFVRPTSGRATVFGEPTDVATTRRLIGYLPEQPYFHRFLKPIEIVSMHAALAGVDRHRVRDEAAAAIKRAGITEYAETPISKLSKGLTQRVGIAQAIVGDPKLLILDEPTSGLDPIGRRHTRDLLLALRDEGRTIFLSSHILSEIENVCDMVAIMRSGRMVAIGTPNEIRQGESHFVIRLPHIGISEQHRLRLSGAEVDTESGETVVRAHQDRLHGVMRIIEELSIPVLGIETRRETLEEAFIRLAA